SGSLESWRSGIGDRAGDAEKEVDCWFAMLRSRKAPQEAVASFICSESDATAFRCGATFRRAAKFPQRAPSFRWLSLALFIPVLASAGELFEIRLAPSVDSDRIFIRFAL